MRIEIDSSVANDPEAHRWLDRILHKIEDGWHVWDTTGQLDPDVFEATTWVVSRRTQGDRVREMFIASIQRGAWTLAKHGRRVRVTGRPVAADELSPEHAARLAEEPLVILVENRFSDGAFVKRVVTELDKTLLGLWRRPGRPVRIDSLGGAGQMWEEVERRTRHSTYRPRLVVIIDSDRKGPVDTASRMARRLLRECERRGVSCWVLAKREAENYLPRILLSEWPNAGPDHARLVAAWNSLTDDQKNFFDMKRGLSSSPSAVEEALFGGLAPTTREILSQGFGDDVSRCWNLWTVRAKAELRRRGQRDLEYGIALIWKEV